MWWREPGRWRDPGQLLVSGRDSPPPIGASPGRRSSLWCPLGRRGAEDEDPRGCSSAVGASPMTSRKVSSDHDCILGCGFGGLYTALRLESLVWPTDKKPQVLLVDQSERFVFKQMLYELLSGEVDVWEIAPSFTELLKNTSVQFVMDSVNLLCPSDHFRREPRESCTCGVVHLESGTVIEYDCPLSSFLS